MGKFHSKHVCKREGPEGECFLVNAHINAGIQEGSDTSEANCGGLKKVAGLVEDQVPFRVVLPPSKNLTDTTQVLTMDLRKSVIPEAETTDNNADTEKSINVEEFECGVSVKGSEQEKQEWSFTLYDFDGRGNVTKEDLARLLQSLYDAVGSSISLPDNGTKTLKLRLTVTPDSSKMNSTGETVNVTTNKKEHTKVNKDRVTFSKDCTTPNNLQVLHEHLQSHKMRLGSVEVKNNLSQTRHSHSVRKNRLTAEEQKQFAELLQKNLEKHQRRQQHKQGKTNNDHKVGPPKDQAPDNRVSASNLENKERQAYYLDLAGIEHYDASSKMHNQTAPAAMLDTGKKSGHQKSHDRSHGIGRSGSRSHGHRAGHCHRQGHQRSKSNDVTNQEVENVTEDYINALNQNFEGNIKFETSEMKSPRLQPSSSSTPKAHRFRPVSLPPRVPEMTSPHYQRRHRHREKNQDRAMKQVAAWIQKENLLASGGEHAVIQRHEHHHIHEHHHHHHYHHYEET